MSHRSCEETRLSVFGNVAVELILQTKIMDKKVIKLVKQIRDEQLAALAAQVAAGVGADSGTMPESRARALLLMTSALDEVTVRDFQRVMEAAGAQRVALAELLEAVDNEQLTVISMALRPIESASWLATAITIFAHKVGFHVEDLDPSSPPSQFTPAGQVVHQTAAWVRGQVTRQATERDKFARRLAFVAPVGGDQNAGNSQQPTVRPTIPVRYFEFNEPLAVDPNEPIVNEPPAVPPLPSAPSSLPAGVRRGEPLRLDRSEIMPEDEIRIVGESVRVPRPQAPPSRTERAAQWVRETVTTENAHRLVDAAATQIDSVVESVRSNVGSTDRPTARVRLKVTVMDYPNGHPLPALQVAIRYQGSRREVAGATDHDGQFIVSLPTKEGPGLTYEVTVQWPREFGGKKEMKRVTVHPERSLFELPFYSRLIA
jgi:hypothetical protein